MPAGVDVAVEDGFATIEFVDPSLRGRGLGKLLEVGTPPELIEKVTRPRVAYIVPEGNARLAGLLDEADAIEAPADGSFTELVSEDTGGPYTILPEIENYDGTTPLEPITAEIVPKAWPDGEPDEGWKRPELDAYARSKGIDPTELPNKDAVLAAIEAKAAEQ